MPRNPKNPRQYVVNPKERYRQKIEILVAFLTQFTFSTREVLLLRLNLNSKSHHVFFKDLVDKKLLKQIVLGDNKNIFTLGSVGKKISSETFGAGSQSYQPTNIGSLAHSLNVQKAVIKLLQPFEHFFVESNIPFTDEEADEKKVADACLKKEGEIVMLEFELSVKSDKRIYRAFTLHAESLLKNIYHKVVYIFSSESLKNHYLNKFKQSKWIYQKKNDQGVLMRYGSFLPEDYRKLRENFQFITMSDL